jgi:hypothetical protein
MNGPHATPAKRPAMFRRPLLTAAWGAIVWLGCGLAGDVGAGTAIDPPSSKSGKGQAMTQQNPFAAFLAAFPPDRPLQPVRGKPNAAREQHLHPLLLRFWSEVGYGSFGDGYLHFFDPREYDDVFAGWLVRDRPDPTRVPFARTAFGDIFYWRDLRSKAAEKGLSTGWDQAGDIYVLSVHHRKGLIVSITPMDFFNGALQRIVLEEPTLYHRLYEQARKRRPRLGGEECYFFVPALALGGPATLEHVDQGDCLVHLEILRQLAQNAG